LADVLSQSEIDELLKALDTGADLEESAPVEAMAKIRDYDFRTANRFSKEQIRTLHIIYENFAHLFATYLTATLRVSCQMDVLSVEELKFQEFSNSLPSPVVLAIMAMEPLAGSLLLEIAPDISYAMLSRLLGGSAEEKEQSRQFTEIETVLMERIIRQFMPMMAEAWGRIITVKPFLERVETNSQFAQIVALNETIAIITLNAKIGRTEGLINICIPHLSIEPINKQLNTRLLFEGAPSSVKHEAANEKILKKIQTTSLNVTAVFNETAATVGDVLGLQIGDVLQLDHRTGDDLTVKVGHLAKFKAALGMRSSRYAVRINSLIREEELEDE